MDIEEEWERAPIGSWLVTDLQTGEQRIEPPCEPMSPEEFFRRARRDDPKRRITAEVRIS